MNETEVREHRGQSTLVQETIRRLESELAARTAELLTTHKELEHTNAGIIALHAELKSNEDRRRHIMDAAPVGMLKVDAEGIILLVNTELERLFGYTREEMVGQKIETLMPERFRASHPGHRAGYMAAPGKRAMGAGRELFGRRKDGSEFPVEIGLNPVETPEGRRVIASIIDITERKRAEAAIRFSEARLSAVVNSAHDAIVMADSRGVIVSWNPAAESTFGHTAAQAVGQPLTLLIPESLRAKHTEGFARFQRTGQSRIAGRTIELAGLHRAGHEFPIELTLSLWEVGGERFTSAIIRDITERKRAEEELRQLNAGLEERVAERMCEVVTLAREQGQIAYSITHNLRTPLRIIQAQVHFLRALGVPLPAEAAPHLDSITASAKTLGSQIDALVRFSGLYRQEIRKECTNSVAVVTAALAEVTEKLGGRIVELPPAPLPPCHANPELLQEVFRSLLSNAYKFTRHVEKPQVEVGGRSEVAPGGGRQTLFWVKDNGIGFDMRFHDKIFDLFQRLNWAGDYEGDGCGLSLAKRIVERHGGRIWAEGEPGKGATFYFSLPEQNPQSEKQP